MCSPKHWTIVWYTYLPPMPWYLKQGIKISLGLIIIHSLFYYRFEFICHTQLPFLLLCPSSSKCMILKQINLRLKLKTIKLFCFPSRGFRYIRIIISLSSFSFQQPPVNGAFLWFFYFELINKDLIWHRLVFPRWKDVRSCQSWFHFLKTTLQIHFYSAVATIIIFFPLSH